MSVQDQEELDTMDGSLAPSPCLLEPGRVVARRYRLGEEIGSGAAGRIHLAERLIDGREVVLKICAGVGRASRDRMRSEARSLAWLDHRNIVRFVEHGECGELAFVAMEAVRGESLEAELARGEMSRASAVLCLYELAQAIDHVHARGLVHRDIKPANVMIEKRGRRVVLVDFGLASDYRRPTKRGQAFVLGTPEYMAPEQALGLEEQIGPATDRYALAAIALELLTGERPYPSMPLGRLLTTILEQRPRRPSELGFGDTALDAVFAKAMAREPARRYPSALEQVEALVAALPRARDVGRPSISPVPAATVRTKAA